MMKIFVQYIVFGVALLASPISAPVAQEVNGGQCSFSYASLDKPECQTLSITILNERMGLRDGKFSGHEGGTGSPSSTSGVGRNLEVRPREGPICECAP
ncbi:MAG: hypothetical protein IPP67_05665 [Rhodospirillaceae bacterium]|nr:hypothetical protein [Rhodospirillaceae bacterium]